MTHANDHATDDATESVAHDSATESVAVTRTPREMVRNLGLNEACAWYRKELALGHDVRAAQLSDAIVGKWGVRP